MIQVPCDHIDRDYNDDGFCAREKLHIAGLWCNDYAVTEDAPTGTAGVLA